MHRGTHERMQGLMERLGHAQPPMFKPYDMANWAIMQRLQCRMGRGWTSHTAVQPLPLCTVDREVERQECGGKCVDCGSHALCDGNLWATETLDWYTRSCVTGKTAAQQSGILWYDPTVRLTQRDHGQYDRVPSKPSSLRQWCPCSGMLLMQWLPSPAPVPFTGRLLIGALLKSYGVVNERGCSA